MKGHESLNLRDLPNNKKDLKNYCKIRIRMKDPNKDLSLWNKVFSEETRCLQKNEKYNSIHNSHKQH